MDEILKIIEEIQKEHPYKVPGNYDTYSQYNQGWTDACNRLDAVITPTLDKKSLTIGDKIRESNESLTEFIKTVTDKCIIGSCRTCPIYKACDQMENKEDLARHFSQPYTE